MQSKRLYIGSTLNHQRRKSQHLYLLRRNEHSNPKLQNHYNKYGEMYMRFTVVECFINDELEYLRKREQEYLNTYYAQEYVNSNYKDKRFDKLTLNVTPEVDLMRVHWTPERRLDLIQRNKDFVWTPELRSQMSETKRGIKLTEEHKLKIAANTKAYFSDRKVGRCCANCKTEDVTKVGKRLNKTTGIVTQRYKCNSCKKSYKVDLETG